MPARIAPRRPVKVFLKEWRVHCGLSQQQVAERFDPPTDKNTISRFETASRGLTLNAIAAYAEALKLPPARLYRPPTKDQSLDELVADAPEDVRRRVRAVVSALVKTDQ